MATIDDFTAVIEPMDALDLAAIFARFQAELDIAKASDKVAELIAYRDSMLADMQIAIANAQTALDNTKNAQAALSSSAPVVKLA
jgi:hypothetical protein